MRVRVAVLADYASISEGAKLNVMGIFAVIFADRVPAAHPLMQLVCQFEFEAAEAGTKDVKIVLRDEDGKEFFSLSGEMVVSRSPSGEPTLVNQILGFNNITFPKFGSYEFLVLLNGKIEADLPLRVVRPPQMPLLNPGP